MEYFVANVTNFAYMNFYSLNKRISIILQAIIVQDGILQFNNALEIYAADNSKQRKRKWSPGYRYRGFTTLWKKISQLCWLFHVNILKAINSNPKTEMILERNSIVCQGSL